ncbi:hypothetical protein BB560_000848 [Smittium megazygosporum]|uniref:Uncharacterized protein n=1 Tax=Smittium megazygosporum TaxID=133381 RepID=A0A2T9ZJ39_9FUNG|nr:hypothetical protein BB560_000848 [Smittium megazygosporum]
MALPNLKNLSGSEKDRFGKANSVSSDTPNNIEYAQTPSNYINESCQASQRSENYTPTSSKITSNLKTNSNSKYFLRSSESTQNKNLLSRPGYINWSHVSDLEQIGSDSEMLSLLSNQSSKFEPDLLSYSSSIGYESDKKNKRKLARGIPKNTLTDKVSFQANRDNRDSHIPSKPFKRKSNSNIFSYSSDSDSVFSISYSHIKNFDRKPESNSSNYSDFSDSSQILKSSSRSKKSNICRKEPARSRKTFPNTPCARTSTIDGDLFSPNAMTTHSTKRNTIQKTNKISKKSKLSPVVAIQDGFPSTIPRNNNFNSVLLSRFLDQQNYNCNFDIDFKFFNYYKQTTELVERNIKKSKFFHLDPISSIASSIDNIFFQNYKTHPVTKKPMAAPSSSWPSRNYLKYYGLERMEASVCEGIYNRTDTTRDYYGDFNFDNREIYISKRIISNNETCPQTSASVDLSENNVHKTTIVEKSPNELLKTNKNIMNKSNNEIEHLESAMFKKIAFADFKNDVNLINATRVLDELESFDEILLLDQCSLSSLNTLANLESFTSTYPEHEKDNSSHNDAFFQNPQTASQKQNDTTSTLIPQPGLSSLKRGEFSHQKRKKKTKPCSGKVSQLCYDRSLKKNFISNIRVLAKNRTIYKTKNQTKKSEDSMHETRKSYISSETKHISSDSQSLFQDLFSETSEYSQAEPENLFFGYNSSLYNSKGGFSSSESSNSDNSCESAMSDDDNTWIETEFSESMSPDFLKNNTNFCKPSELATPRPNYYDPSKYIHSLPGTENIKNFSFPYYLEKNSTFGCSTSLNLYRPKRLAQPLTRLAKKLKLNSKNVAYNTKNGCKNKEPISKDLLQKTTLDRNAKVLQLQMNWLNSNGFGFMYCSPNARFEIIKLVSQTKKTYGENSFDKIFFGKLMKEAKHSSSIFAEPIVQNKESLSILSKSLNSQSQLVAQGLSSVVLSKLDIALNIIQRLVDNFKNKNKKNKVHKIDWILISRAALYAGIPQKVVDRFILRIIQLYLINKFYSSRLSK